MHKNRQGQMTLIMILLIAFALIFYAIAVNWSRIATTKASVTIASNTGASTLVSMMASYGEYVLQTSLGGQASKCSNTSLLASIIVLIILIIIIVVITIATAGTATPATLSLVSGGLNAFYTGVVIAAVATTAAIILQATVIQPGLTKQWNKWQQAISTTEDQFLERGLQTALTGIVSDPVNVPDRWDMDMDARWYDPDSGRGDKDEMVSRFSYYYTDRMKGLQVLNENEKVRKLRAILEGISKKLGILSSPGTTPPVCLDGGVVRPECNHCCVEKTVRPVGCYTDSRSQEEKDAGVPAWDKAPEVHPGCGAKNAYDPLYEMRHASGYDNTLVKALGLDDGKSEVGYFNGAESTPDSVFRLLWGMADSQAKTQDIMASDVNLDDPACHWCAAQGTGGACTPAAGHLYRPAGLADQLVLPACSGNNCCVNYFWSDTAIPSSASSVMMDKIGDIPFTRPVAPNQCAAANDEWKKGADFNQDTFVDAATQATYPVKMADNPAVPGTPAAACANPPAGGDLAAAVDGCMCSSVPPANRPYWNDDVFDLMAADLGTYKQAADVVIRADSGLKRKQLAANPDMWAKLLKEQAVNFAPWRETMAAWSNSISGWLRGPYGEAGLWCLPASAAGMSANEEAAIKAGTTWGSLASVINCLEYNTQNADLFKACTDDCRSSNPACGNVLPRSLVNGFSPNTMTPAEKFGPLGVCRASFKDNLVKSLTLAEQQVPKFRKRADYLTTLKGQAEAFNNVIVDAEAYLLDIKDPDTGASLGTAEKAISDLVDSIVADKDSPGNMALGNKIIYGWFSPRPASWGNSGRKGYLHIVKVEAAIPGRKDGMEDINTCVNRLPWVHTYTKRMKTKRCYELMDHSGCVGVRVLRYDEDHDPSRGGVMSFLSGLPLWRITYHNPHGDGVDVAAGSDPNSDIINACFMRHFSRRWTGASPAYVELDASEGFPRDVALQEAFMLNLPLDGTAGVPEDLANCLALAEKRLEKGVYAETCAKYYLEGNQYKIGFRKCSECCSR